MGSTWVTDLRHFLEPETGHFPEMLPASARKHAEYFSKIVCAATAVSAGPAFESVIRCRRRPGRRPCLGRLVIQRVDLPASLSWACPRCDDQGVISGWENTVWDYRRFQWTASEDDEVLNVLVSFEAHAAMSDIKVIDGESEAVLIAGRPKPDGILLTAPYSYFEELAAYVSREEREARGHRRRHLGSGFDALWNEMARANDKPPT